MEFNFILPGVNGWWKSDLTFYYRVIRFMVYDLFIPNVISLCIGVYLFVCMFVCGYV